VYALFVIAAQNIYALTSLVLPNRFEGNGFHLKGWFLLQGALVVFVAPWLAVLRRQILDTQQRSWIPEPTLGSIYDIFVEFAGSLPLLVLFMLLTALSTLSLFVPSRFAGASPKRNYGAEASRLYLLSLWLLIPTLLPFVISKISAPMLVDRYTIAASLAFYLLVSRGLESVVGNFPLPVIGRFVGFALIIGVAALSLASTYGDLHEANKPQWREAADYVDANAKSGDLVLVSPGYDLETAFDYYSRREDLEKVPFPAEGNSITGEDMRALEEITAGHDRVWLVFDRFAMEESSEEMIKQELKGSYALADQEEPNLIDVMLWSTR
jgi:mannosyltransferase